MKVGVILGEHSPGFGGGFTFESEVLKSLVKVGAESKHTFVLVSWAKEQPEQISAAHIQSIYINYRFRQFRNSKLWGIAAGIFKKLRHPKSKFKIENWLENHLIKSVVEHKIEVIWCLNPWVCQTMEVPYITVVWDLQHRLQPYFPEVSTEGQWNWREQSYQIGLRRAAVILTGSETGKAEIERFYQVPAEQIRILPLPTPSFALDALPEHEILVKYNLPGNYLFYPAQFWPHKNHVGLLLAVQLLRDKYNLVFPVVFVGSDKGNLEYIRLLVAELDLTTQVHFLGFIPQTELISLYRNAFALIFLSFFGPDNLPPLEAFALGCPVVAANVSGAQEQLGDAALLVNPKEPEHIALAIKSLHNDQALCQILRQRGLKRASKWTGQNYVQGVLSIIDEFEPIRRCWSSKKYHQG